MVDVGVLEMSAKQIQESEQEENCPRPESVMRDGITTMANVDLQRGKRSVHQGKQDKTEKRKNKHRASRGRRCREKENTMVRGK